LEKEVKMPRFWRRIGLIPATLFAMLLGFAVAVQAQQTFGSKGAPSNDGPPRATPQEHVGPGGTNKFSNPEPYGGQLFCPVTGIKLGLKQPAVMVQTSIGEQKPTGLAKLFGKKPVPGAAIYVCCPRCAEQVRLNPERYLGEVVADKAYFSAFYTYLRAPAQRPARAGEPPPIEQASAPAPKR
jgi:hypothetical protein